MIFVNGHLPEAEQVARAVAEALPTTIDAWVVFAYVALKNGHKPAASAAAEKAIALDPNNRTARDVLTEADGAPQ